MTQPAAGAAAGVELGATVDQLSAGMIALYAAAERQLVSDLGTLARRGISDGGMTALGRMLGELQQAAQRVANALTLRAEPLTSAITAEAVQRGDAAAQTVLRQLAHSDPRLSRLYLTGANDVTGHGLAAAAAIQLDLSARLDQLRLGILRKPDDIYRAAVAEASTRLALGRDGLTPATAQAQAWRRLVNGGLTSFTDQRGRTWSLATYAETATRTAVQRAFNAAHQDRMTTVGIDYFTVTHDGHPCPICRPWEGAVLSAGSVGLVVAANAATGQPVAFTVAATVDQARAAGLEHPNCRHVLLPYLPGVTKTRPAAPWNEADQRRYDATQQLRYLERQVRQSKTQAEAARALGDQDALARARARTRSYQARIRQHTAANGLVRRSRREQLNLGNR